MVQQVSDAELDIMRIIWANNAPTLFSFIMKRLEDEGKTWQKNTVITLLSRLMQKGFLKAKKTGRCNEYTALVSETDYQTIQTKYFLNKIYKGNTKGLVSNLIQSDLLTPQEYKELEKILEGGETET